MDFTWSPAQLEYKNKVVTFARDCLQDNLKERDRCGEFSTDHWQKCAAFGIQGMAMPAEYSGTEEQDILTGLLMMEALGYACADNGFTFALNAQMWTVQLPILHHGSRQQKARLLPCLCQGKSIGAHAMTEPNTGSDAFAMETTAEKVAGGYLLNGSKAMISLAPIADVFLLFASTAPSLGKWGISAFLINKGTPGLTVSPPIEKMGLRTVPMGNIQLSHCLVAEEDRLGPEGAGASLSISSLEFERCCILASQLGAMERQLEQTIAYAKSRHQFGQPIAKFQSVSNRIVDMKMRLETARLLLYHVGWLKQQGKPAMMEAALLKLYLSEQFVASGIDAIRTYGGKGFLTETGVERDLRDAIGGILYAGTSDIQRNIIAGLLGL